MLPIFVIEHLEEDYFDWCRHEYTHAALHLAPAQLIITNFPYPHQLPSNVSTTLEKAYDFLSASRSRTCLLDSESPNLMQPSDANMFDYILLGGILGNGNIVKISYFLVDEFDEDRTKVLRAEGYPTRNLGQMQMPTDTAAIVAKRILIDRIPFKHLVFVDRPEIRWNDKERTVMDFRYLMKDDGQPLISEGVLDIIRTEDIDLDFLQ